MAPSHAISLPSGPTSFASTNGERRPWEMRSFHASSGSRPSRATATEPSGLVSVMPHACTMCMPWRSSKAFMSEGGHAEPPTSTMRKLLRSIGFLSTNCRSPVQIVGTAPAKVGFSLVMMRAMPSGWRNLSGSTRAAPTSMHAHGKPHAQTWNMGTTASTRSREPTPVASPRQSCIECNIAER